MTDSGSRRSGSTNDELSRAARGSALTLVGAAASAGLGFAFNIVLARQLGATGAGVVLQAVAVFTISLSVTRLGLDTTAVWLLPRLVRSAPERVRMALVGVLLPALVVPGVVTLGWLAVRYLVLAGSGRSATLDAVTAAVLFLPAASVMTVALASTRAFGSSPCQSGALRTSMIPAGLADAVVVCPMATPIRRVP